MLRFDEEHRLKQTIEYVVIFVAFIISLFLVFNFMPKKGDVVVINCGISEISPDFTTEMREACRQARAQNIQKDLQKPK
jgi:hypothetical protein